MIHDIQTFLLTFVLLTFSLVFDWLCQTNNQAENKANRTLTRATHAIIYVLLTMVVFWIFHYYTYRQLVVIAVLLFVTHFLIDQRGITLFWIRRIKCVPDEQIAKMQWLIIVVDQCLHIIVNFIIAFLIVLSP
jgi:VanZ family protein